MSAFVRPRKDVVPTGERLLGWPGLRNEAPAALVPDRGFVPQPRPPGDDVAKCRRLSPQKKMLFAAAGPRTGETSDALSPSNRRTARFLLPLFVPAPRGTMRSPVPQCPRSGAAMHVRLLRPLFVVCLALATSHVRAEGQEWPVARGPAKAPAPVAFAPAVCKRLPAAFLDDAPACVLFSGTTQRLLPDGTVETTTQELTRLNGR